MRNVTRLNSSGWREDALFIAEGMIERWRRCYRGTDRRSTREREKILSEHGGRAKSNSLATYDFAFVLPFSKQPAADRESANIFPSAPVAGDAWSIRTCTNRWSVSHWHCQVILRNIRAAMKRYGAVIKFLPRQLNKFFGIKDIFTNQSHWNIRKGCFCRLTLSNAMNCSDLPPSAAVIDNDVLSSVTK